MEYKIVSGGSPSDLSTKVNERLNDGWKVVGSHQVVIHREQNRFSGQQHMDTLNSLEYSQTMVKEFKPNVIEVDIALAERMLKFILDEDNHTEGELGNSCLDVQTLVYFIEQFKKK